VARLEAEVHETFLSAAKQGSAQASAKNAAFLLGASLEDKAGLLGLAVAR